MLHCHSGSAEAVKIAGVADLKYEIFGEKALRAFSPKIYPD
jgi:hypothetical protein